MDFYEWLELPILCGGSERRRANCISKFTTELYEFVQKMGYHWGISETGLRDCIATGLYENEGVPYLESVWNYPTVNSNATEEDKIHYDYVMNDAVWKQFWLKNGYTKGRWADVDTTEYYGWDRRMDIQNFVWGQLILEKSWQTDELEEILLGGEEVEQVSQKQGYNTYLQESVEYSGWGGYRK